jgi:hypothetical protein
VRIDCGYRELDTYSTRSGSLALPGGSTLWLQRCYATNHYNTTLTEGPGAWCTLGSGLLGGSEAGGAVIRMEDSTLRWWNQARRH